MQRGTLVKESGRSRFSPERPVESPVTPDESTGSRKVLQSQRLHGVNSMCHTSLPKTIETIY